MAETRGRYGDDAGGDAADDARRMAPRHVGVAEAKGTFSAMIEGVQHRGERYVIERHGKPAAALVSLDELERLGDQRPAPKGMTGGLGFIGLWGNTPSDVIDEMIDHIYAERERDMGREVDTSDWVA